MNQSDNKTVPSRERKQLTPRQRDRRARILRAARELIDEAGYTGMTMRELANRADVAARTVFNLYHTKEELLLAALREQLTGMTTELDEACGEPGWQRIVAFLGIIAQQSDRTPAYAKAIVDALLQAQPGEPVVRMLIDNFGQVIVESLEAMQAARQLQTDVDPEDLASNLVAVFWGIELLWNKGVLDSAALHRMVNSTVLSLLAQSTRGKTRKEIEALL